LHRARAQGRRDAEFVACMRADCIVMHQLLGDLLCRGGLEPTGDIDRHQLTVLRRRVGFEFGALA
jgi:hypothetical protein